MIFIKFKKLHPEAVIPRWQTEGSIGMDVHALLIGDDARRQKLMIPPRTVRPCRTGLAFETDSRMPFYLQCVSRSGMVAKQCMWVANAPGIIDLDYRGELMVLLYNGGLETQWVQHGDRIAQLLVTPAIIRDVHVAEVEELSETVRGEGGFGSTGR